MAKKTKKRKFTKVSAKTFEPKLLEATAQNAADLIAEVGEDAEALVIAWAKNDRLEAVSAVAQGEGFNSSVRKAARRGLQILRSRGKVEESVAKTASPVAVSDELIVEAWLLPPDGSGVSMFTIASHREGKAYDVADIRVHDSAGVIEMRAGGATRSSIRKAFQSMKEKWGLEPVSVPVPWARWRVAQAKANNAKTGTILPLGFDRAADLLEPVPESEPTHPVDVAGLSVSEDDMDERVARSGLLHNEPEFYSWLPNVEVMNEMLAKVGGRLGNPPTEDQELVNKIIAEEVVSTTDRLFTPELRGRIASLMRDSAISLYARGKKELAVDALTAAEAARRAGLITSPPSEIPFFKVFVEKGISALAASNNGRLNIPVPKPQDGVLQAPPEVIEEAAKSHTGRQDAEAAETSEGEDSDQVVDAATDNG